jgi:hypothetical protein
MATMASKVQMVRDFIESMKLSGDLPEGHQWWALEALVELDDRLKEIESTIDKSTEYDWRGNPGMRCNCDNCS